MTRIDKLKALCEGLDADPLSIRLTAIFKTSEQVPELLELVQEMAGALEKCKHRSPLTANKALAKYKAWNEGE